MSCNGAIWRRRQHLGRSPAALGLLTKPYARPVGNRKASLGRSLGLHSPFQGNGLAAYAMSPSADYRYPTNSWRARRRATVTPSWTLGQPRAWRFGRMARVPDSGEVVWMTMYPSVGHEQARRRAALVLSPAAYNGKAGLGVLCPITSQATGYPFEVALSDGLEVSGVVLADQVTSLGCSVRGADFACRVSLETSDEAVRKRVPVLPSWSRVRLLIPGIPGVELPITASGTAGAPRGWIAGWPRRRPSGARAALAANARPTGQWPARRSGRHRR